MGRPAVLEFLDQDYRYKSVAMRTLRDSGLTPTRSAGNRTRDCYIKGNDFALQRRTSIHILKRKQLHRGLWPIVLYSFSLYILILRISPLDVINPLIRCFKSHLNRS